MGRASVSALELFGPWNWGLSFVKLITMKTAISVPNDLFERAEKASKKLQTSRSKLYALVLDKFQEARV